MKVIITGSTGMVGEGVILECLQNNRITSILSISRKPTYIKNEKYTELIVPDFTKLSDYSDKIKGYDACFFCAGISSVGLNEEQFTHITYTTTMSFANALLQVNPNISFCYISGAATDSSEKGKVMWARVKGKTENDLKQLPFKKEYNLRPGAMVPFPNQQFSKSYYNVIAKMLQFILPSKVISLSELAIAMINAVERENIPNVLEIKDIKKLAQS